MASTTIIPETLAQALYQADPNRIADALRKYGIGVTLSPQKFTWLGSTGATAVNITTAAFAALAVPGPNTPTFPQGVTTLPAIMNMSTLRVTTGPSGSVGNYGLSDSGGAPALVGISGASGAQTLGIPGIATISDDGTTITFPAQVSGFVIEYVPRSLYDVNLPFEHS